ncbi:lytic transglycosylase [Sedimenticola thiotaurini]|uniref:Lytic transglycosylase n=1 Tax=Sedimenticola thiotaurini TaxID=1543721 RepID=A0A0F7K0S6_9GAMM|nr:LysM peptidoglycan-binding domain-containing protein [Sedimenticola thiotaurini]AKH22121.1 lytic transglycosylase [Sedimenticola thiotaurini]
MSTRFLTLPLLTALALSGCNTLGHKAELNTDDTELHSVTARTDTALAAEQRLHEALVSAPQVVPLPDSSESGESEQQAADSSPDNLMDRLRAGFRLEIPDNPRIDQQIRWFTANSDYLDRVQNRAAPYLHFIVEEAERRGIPSELALLPIVESGFQPFAYSHGRAAGLWQFIPSTGKHFGLQQNWWYDGRRDVVAATRAAFKYLGSLAERFDGDWELALASYNAGAGTVQRAIKRNQQQGKPTDFWSLKLPDETMRYVPKLFAVAKVMADPEQYGVTLVEIPNEPYFDSIDIDSQLDLALAADMAGISIEELYKLNPGFNRWATAPNGPHRLSIPVEKVEQFNKALAELDPQKRLHWTRYKIHPGDNLGSIARKYKTTVALLRQVNKLKGNNIRAGKHLLIPVAAKSLDQYTHTADARLAKTQNRQHKGKRVTHKVVPGDTLWDIARRYRVNHRALARWNGMSPRDTLRPGQQLVIWQQTNKGQQNAAQLVPTLSPPVNTRSSLRYRVRKGDSLALIAQRFNVSVSDLRKWNTLDDRYLQPGQRLQLFVDVTEQTL